MDSSTFEVLANLLPWVSIIIFTIFAAFWFHLRAGTSYGLLNRLYAIVIGGKEFHDSSITEFWNERKDVERFNALFNTRVKSLKEMNNFIRWININNLDLRKLSNLNDFFDMEKMEVKKGPYFIGTYFFLCVTFSLSLISIYLVGISGKDAALVKFKDEKQWIWLSHDAAYSTEFNPLRNKAKDWRLTVENCSQAASDLELFASEAKIKPENIKIICESFSNEDDIQRVNDIIENQRSFVWFALAFILISLYSYKFASQLNTARKANNYLNKEFDNSAKIVKSSASEDSNNATSKNISGFKR